MQKYISELTRLYLQPGTLSPAALEQHLLGQTAAPVSLASGDGRTRAIVIPFHKQADGAEADHWTLLCEVANALQAELALPAPAVSISGADGYALWLSLAAPLPLAEVRQFLELLRTRRFPAMAPAPDAAVELPPCLHPRTGKWAAFIHPGLGASFAAEAGLEMSPPFAGQSALLEGVQCISDAQFRHALAILQPAKTSTPAPAAPAGLLLADATLEDIVRHLHARHIEPTFRHLVRD
ncbi:MAG: hypothetical protein V4633_08495 [Pseudomonadota bacterium]